MEKRTEIDELGEFGLIERIQSKVETYNPETIKGIGDDSAVIKSGEQVMLVSSDLLLEGVHFDLSYMPIQHLGYKSVVVNASDIAAMNGIAKQVTVNLGLSSRISVEAVDKFYEGVNSACKNYKLDLVGGDTSSSPAGLIISVTAMGVADPKEVSYRSGARDKDIICVTGDLGGAYTGLQVLEREKQVFLSNPEMQPKLEGYDYIVQRQLKPEARIDIIHELKELGIVPTSMIDVSDGLASDLLHITHQSSVGARIFEDKLPIDQLTYQVAVEFKLDPITCVLNGGEDYELLFTISQGDFEKVEKHPDIHFIGYVEKDSKEVGLVTKNEQWVPISAQGWNHFKKD